MACATKDEVKGLCRKVLGLGTYPAARRTHGAWWLVELFDDARGPGRSVVASFEDPTLGNAYGQAAVWLRGQRQEVA